MGRICLVVILALHMAAPAQAQDSVSTSNIWYASILKSRFPQGVPIHRVNYQLTELPVHSRDITRFQITPEVVQAAGVRALRINGTLQVGAIEPPFDAVTGRYMLHFQAYLFSPEGRLVWQQQGFPARDAWVQATGGRVEFMLINTYTGRTRGHELLIIAAGDPVFSDLDETRVLLGAIRRTLD